MLTRTIAIFILILSSMPASMAGEFRSGAAMRVITPDPLLPISGGVGEPNAATQKRGELTARAMVFSNGETTIAVVGIDALGFPAVLGDRIRKLIPRLPAANILIGATHTHSAPDCYAFPLPSGGSTGDLNYMQSVCEKAAAAVNQAIDEMQPASLKIGSGKAAERIAYNYYAPQLYDRRMGVIQTLAADGKVIGTLINYAIHPEVLGSESGIASPDCIGPMADQIEERFGGVALFINSAQGGMVTADNRDFSQPGDLLKDLTPDTRSWDECLRIGHLMASEADRIISQAPVQESPEVRNMSQQIEFPVESAMMRAIVAGSPLKYPHTDDFKISVQVNLVRLGNTQILTIPGEALPNIGFYLKRKMKGEHNLLFGLTNDAFGYILTKVDFDSFDRYAYVSRTSLGEMTGEIFIENALNMIESEAK